MATRRTFLSGAGLSAAGWFGLAGSSPSASSRGEQAEAPVVVRVVVAADGSGDFATVQRAVDHVLDRPPQSVERVILEIRPGVYRERVKIPQDRPRLTLLGQDAASTVITASMSAKAAGGTFFSPVVEVNGAAFSAENITFENSFGTGSQAVALSVHSDRAVFRKCRFTGWQDTLYAAWGRQYYRDCYIEGHVDFIFGNAAAVFDRCEVHSRGSGYITAHSRTSPREATGYVFRECKLTGEPGLLVARGPRATPPTPPPAAGVGAAASESASPEVPFPLKDSGRGVLLGRPWRSHARVVFLDCWMGEHIRKEGWDNWGKPDNEKSAWYGERGSSGPGANTAARAAWAHSALTAEEAAAFAPEVFLKGGDGWRPLPAGS